MASAYLESDPRFYAKLVQVANNVGLSPEDILVVMALESGINPYSHNSNYGGLVQMSDSTLKGLGYSGGVKDFSEQPAFKQLDTIEKHILRLANLIGGKFESATQYYIGNLLPVGLKLDGVKNKEPETIIVAKSPTTPHLPNVSIEREQVFYNSNKGLDLDRDGAITYGDIDNFLNKKRKEIHYTHAISQLPQQSINKENEGKDLILEQINSYLENILASKKVLAKNSFTIGIVSQDLDSSVEFSRVLTLGLRESLGARVTSHINKNRVQVTCTIDGPKNMSKKIVQSFTDHLVKCFYKKTSKIGGIKVSSRIISDKKSEYNFIDYKMASLSYRRFLTKFIEV